MLWVIGLYSLAFSEGNALIGDFKHLFLSGITVDELNGGTFPETVFVMFQMTFAIITPALIVGAFVERMKFTAVMLFTALWLLIVYVPVAHWVWAGTGWMFNNGTIDLAGGLVVHVTAGTSALILAKMLGPRQDFPHRLHPPHHHSHRFRTHCTEQRPTRRARRYTEILKVPLPFTSLKI